MVVLIGFCLGFEIFRPYPFRPGQGGFRNHEKDASHGLFDDKYRNSLVFKFEGLVKFDVVRFLYLSFSHNSITNHVSSYI